MSAGRRWVKREGRAATLHTFDPEAAVEADLDEYGDPTATGKDAGTSTTVVVDQKSEKRTVRAAGGSVEWDVEMIVPDDLTVDPEATERWPELTVGSETYVVFAVDDNAVEGLRRLLGTRR